MRAHRRSGWVGWLRRKDSNLQSPDPESGALPIWPLLSASANITKRPSPRHPQQKSVLASFEAKEASTQKSVLAALTGRSYLSLARPSKRALRFERRRLLDWMAARQAGVVELVDTRDLKSLGAKAPCGFESRPWHPAAPPRPVPHTAPLHFSNTRNWRNGLFSASERKAVRSVGVRRNQSLVARLASERWRGL